MFVERSHQLGVGPLTGRRVIADALGMLRQSFVRIAGVAVVFFAFPAGIVALTESVVESLGHTDSLAVFTFALAGLIVAAALRVLGPIAFSGFLDEAVAKEYLHGHHRTLADALRRLPWRPLIVADVIVTVVVAIGMAFFIIPGLVLFGMFGLIGPVVVQERAPLRASFRRTVDLARRVPWLVFALVVTPFAFEEVLHALIFQALHSSGIGVQVIAEWIVAIVVGGTLGLLEVALASELMARFPLQDSGATRPT